MRVAVTGATGFVGREVVRRLAAEGHDVIAVARGASGAPAPAAGVELRPADVLDPEALTRAFSGARALVHLVGVIVEPRGRTFDDVHRRGTECALAAAEAAGVERIAHMSAMGADPAGPSEYSRSKARGESAVRQSRLAWTIFRPSLIFGPGSEFFATLARIVRLNPLAVPVIGPGTVRFMPVSLEETARLFVECLGRRDTEGRTFNVGGPEILTLDEITRAVAACLGRPRARLLHVPVPLGRALAAAVSWLPRPPVTRDQLDSLSADNVADTSETAEAFGAFRTTLREGLRRFLG